MGVLPTNEPHHEVPSAMNQPQSDDDCHLKLLHTPAVPHGQKKSQYSSRDVLLLGTDMQIAAFLVYTPAMTHTKTAAVPTENCLHVC